MKRWFYLENDPHFIETIPDGFREAGISLTVLKSNTTPDELTAQLSILRPDVILTTGWTPSSGNLTFVW